MIIQIDKAFNKDLYLFMIKTTINVCLKGTYLNMINAIYDKPTLNIVLYYEKLKAFLLT